MDWICATCGRPNGSEPGCRDCGQAAPDYGAQRALLGPVLNVNYGVINNYSFPGAGTGPGSLPAKAELTASRKAGGIASAVLLAALGTALSVALFFALTFALL